MFKKILVAIDNTPNSQPVFEGALSLAQMSQANLLLLHVLSSEEEGSPLPIPPSLGDPYAVAAGSEVVLESWLKQWEIYESECLKQLQGRAAEANTVGVTAEFRQVRGSGGRTICSIAQSWAADLIVIGNRGRSGLSELFLGSVSNYVLHHAPCSVLTIKVTPHL
jgi:nucleotide-binding universal stress UspA family protein